MKIISDVKAGDTVTVRIGRTDRTTQGTIMAIKPRTYLVKYPSGNGIKTESFSKSTGYPWGNPPKMWSIADHIDNPYKK